MKDFIAFETRSDATKMAPWTLRDDPGVDGQICATVQYREMLDHGSLFFSAFPKQYLDMMLGDEPCPNSGGVQEEARLVCKPVFAVHGITERSKADPASWNAIGFPHISYSDGCNVALIPYAIETSRANR